jgi:carbonic anhydrase
LTTPKCDEKVNWFVSQKVIKISPEQLSGIVRMLNLDGFPTNRPLQPLNGRNVYQYMAEFSYDLNAFNGPNNWGKFWPACGGLRQSPIDISSRNVQYYQLADIYNSAPGSPQNSTLFNTGYTVEVVIGDEHRRNEGSSSTSYVVGSTLLKDRHQLLQYHWHTPSEHTVDGEQFPLEVHYVHQDSVGRLSVVGVFYKLQSQCNSDLQPVIDGLSKIPSSKDTTPITVKIQFPDMGWYWHYVGSLTNPPCTEIVDWFVYQRPQGICQDQLTAMTKAIPKFPNSRPVQPLNGRLVYAGSAGSMVASLFLVVFALFCAM